MEQPEPTVKSRRVFQGRILAVRVDTVRMGKGKLTTREVVEHGPSVTVVPLDDRMNVVMVRQYRKAVEQTLLEVPAGGMNQGEGPEACAQRELEEETGYRAERMEPLASFFMTPGFCDEEMHAFLATGLTPGQPHPDEDERIETMRVPLARVPELIRNGEIRDAKSIAALLLVIERVKLAG